MVALMGTLSEMKTQNLLDSILYLCGVSGSTWCMSALYKDKDWSSQVEKREEEMVETLTTGTVTFRNKWKRALESVDDENCSLTDIWAGIIVHDIVKKVIPAFLSRHIFYWKMCKLLMKLLHLMMNWTWGTKFNFLYQFPNTESRLPSDLVQDEKIYLVDAGLSINCAYPLVLRPERQVQLILSFDFSAGDPFKMNAVAETLLDGKQKDELCEKIKQIPMSRCCMLDFNTEKKEFCEDLLGVTQFETHTRGKDIYMAIKEMLRKKGIDLKQVVSITSDGAPAMIGRERGAVAHLNPELTAYHCIIRQSVLCANLSEEYAQVMNIIMKLINFLRASREQRAKWINELNVKLQGKNNSVCDLMTAVCSFQRKALHTLTMFGSTYSCESSFSTMNIIKNKYRSRLNNEHLHMCMRMALTPFQPRFKLLAGQAKAHFSH
ncbi:PA24C phospholipase, partial [Amia calva]|nr:PA24C phospholipase [Amia calva]